MSITFAQIGEFISNNLLWFLIPINITILSIFIMLIVKVRKSKKEKENERKRQNKLPHSSKKTRPL